MRKKIDGKNIVQKERVKFEKKKKKRAREEFGSGGQWGLQRILGRKKNMRRGNCVCGWWGVMREKLRQETKETKEPNIVR